MVITESQMGFGRNISGLNLLDNMSYLTEAESVYAPAMVPVIESQTYGAHLIRLEDMISFAESNGIEDLGYALSCVCEASDIDPSTVAFTVQTESVIADPEIAGLVYGIMNEGVNIAAIPVNPNHIASQAVDFAVTNLIESGSDYLFNIFITEGGLAGDANADDIYDSMGGFSTGLNPEEQANAKKAEGLMNKIKGYANKGRDFIAKYIAKLHDWAVNINKKMHEVPSDKRTFWESIKKKITGAIAWLTARLSKIGTDYGGNRRENPKYWDNKDNKKEESK